MNEKLISEFSRIGCKSRKQSALALQVYLELAEVKKYWDVDYKYSEDLERLYLTAKKTKSSETTVFVPAGVSDKFCIKSMQKYFQLCENPSKKSVCLVICSGDCTCVYYQISEGIGDPPAEIPVQSVESRREKLHKDLRKHKKLLEQSAMYGIPITIAKPKETATDNLQDQDECSDEEYQD